MKVAVILPGSINDQSWNSLGYQGVLAIQKQFGAEIAYSENVQPADQIDTIRDYVSRSFNVIFVHGGQFEDAALTVAKDAPEVMFFVTAGAKGNGKNVIALDAARDQMMYGVGFLGAKLSKSGQVGMVTSLEGVPAVVSATCGFRAGAKAANPDVKVSLIYLPDMEDVAKAREASLTLVGSGVDFVVGDLNRAVQGVIDVAKEKSISTAGRLPSHIEAYPDGIMTTAVEDWSNMYPSMITLMNEKKLTDKPAFLGRGAGFNYVFTGTNELNPKVPVDVADAWNLAVQEVADGKVTIPVNADCSKGGTQ